MFPKNSEKGTCPTILQAIQTNVEADKQTKWLTYWASVAKELIKNVLKEDTDQKNFWSANKFSVIVCA